MSKERSVFETLEAIDVLPNVKVIKLKTGPELSYLSWSDAITFLLRAYPDATWEVLKDETRPYFKTDCGVFVEVAVTINGLTRKQVHPVMDQNHNAIPEPNARQIGDSIARALAKAIALHGLGLNVYRGEDLPHGDSAPQKRAQSTKSSKTTRTAPKDCRWMSSKYAGQCCECKKSYAVGDTILYHFPTKLAKCEDCGESTRTRPDETSKPDDDIPF
jgi:hypothetical protein